MEDNNTLPLKRFSSKAMLSNIGAVKSIIQRIRQQEGGIGSLEDELSLHRMIQDLDLLVDMIDGVKAKYDELCDEYETATASIVALQKQIEGLKGVYERMVQERNDRIKELEEQLGLRPKKTEPEPTPDTPPSFESLFKQYMNESNRHVDSDTGPEPEPDTE